MEQIILFIFLLIVSFTFLVSAIVTGMIISHRIINSAKTKTSDNRSFLEKEKDGDTLKPEEYIDNF